MMQAYKTCCQEWDGRDRLTTRITASATFTRRSLECSKRWPRIKLCTERLWMTKWVSAIVQNWHWLTKPPFWHFDLFFRLCKLIFPFWLIPFIFNCCMRLYKFKYLEISPCSHTKIHTLLSQFSYIYRKKGKRGIHTIIIRSFKILRHM